MPECLSHLLQYQKCLPEQWELLFLNPLNGFHLKEILGLVSLCRLELEPADRKLHQLANDITLVNFTEYSLELLRWDP